jgi:hypothetical protein
MAENLTVIRSDGSLDLFAAVNTGASFALRHGYSEANGGAVLYNDFLGSDQGINLVDAAWRNDNKELYVRAFLQDESLYEWVWSAPGGVPVWAGPTKLK